ncbi:MAG: ABC transporter permease [Candidatus Aenigmarchaeota archaeon]|nr:ABC transporter permease [Candidatus Aenigmarchaeota archaeon]
MFQDIYTVWLREMIRFVRARSRIVSSLAMPFFWLIFIGVGFGSSITLPGTSYIDFLAPGIIGMIILFTSIFSGVSVIWDRQFGFLKEILVAPVSRTSIMLGKTLGGSTVALVSALIMLAVALAIGLIHPGLGILTAILFMFLTAVCFVSIGLIIASQMKSTEGFQMIMSFLIMPIFFLSGALFPMQNTPQWMQAISHLDPLSYGVDGIRGSLVGISIFPLWLDFTVLAALAISFALIGAYLFRKSAL